MAFGRLHRLRRGGDPVEIVGADVEALEKALGFDQVGVDVGRQHLQIQRVDLGNRDGRAHGLQLVVGRQRRGAGVEVHRQTEALRDVLDDLRGADALRVAREIHVPTAARLGIRRRGQTVVVVTPVGVVAVTRVRAERRVVIVIVDVRIVGWIVVRTRDQATSVGWIVVVHVVVVPEPRFGIFADVIRSRDGGFWEAQRASFAITTPIFGIFGWRKRRGDEEGEGWVEEGKRTQFAFFVQV